jgi:ElaA protein
MDDLRWQVATFDEIDNRDLYAILRLRQEVFVVEQDCIFPDLDGLDFEATHMMCWRESELLGYQRCLKPGVTSPESSIGRIVTAPQARGIGLGRELVRRGIELNFRQWPDSDIRIGAQARLEKFYEGFGFVRDGDDYMEDGIAHVHMIKSRVKT